MKRPIERILTFTAIVMLLAGCGNGGGGSSSGTPAVVPPDPFAPVYCEGCIDPAPSTWLWAAGSTFSLKIEGMAADNPAMEAFRNYPQYFFCLLQWNPGTNSYKRTSCADYTGTKPGTYAMEYFVWDGLGEFCLNDKWCSAGGPGYVELYVDDGSNPPWRVYAIPEIYPPYM